MKKRIKILCGVVMILFIFTANAFATSVYDFPNGTLVLAYKGASESNYPGWTGWFDVIGKQVIVPKGSGQPTGYETFGANIQGNTLQLFTNWKGGLGDPEDTGVQTADLFFDLGCNGTWDKAVGLHFPSMTYNQALTANVYGANLTHTTSYDKYYNNNNFIYGGKFNPAKPEFVPTRATSQATGTTQVTWNFFPDATGAFGDPGDPFYRIDVDLTGLDLTGPYGFVWGSGDCANDTIQGCVPIPGAILLLGAGLTRILAYARRRQEL